MTPSLRWLAWLPVAALYLFLWSRMAPIAASDPERYFHLALSERTLQGGLVRKLPEVENLGWDRSFANPYGVFTLVATAARAVGGEAGALALVPILGLLTLFLLHGWMTRYLRPWESAWLLACLLCTPAFLSRLTLFRPHLLAIPSFLLVCFALWTRRTVPLFLAAAAFAAVYHAIYLPVVAIVATLAATLQSERFPWRLGVAGLGGIVVGLGLQWCLGSPAVLAPMMASLLHSGISGAAGADAVGTLAESLRRYFFFLALAVATVVLGVRSRRPELRGPVLLLGVLWMLMPLSPRILEYVLPATLAVAALVLAGYESLRRSGPVLAAVLVVSVVGVGAAASELFRSGFRAPLDVAARIESVERLPKDPLGRKVLNCEWNTSPFVLYYRPGYRVVDIGDPGALPTIYPGLAFLREQLRSGQIEYPFGVARFAFDADYVLCEHPEGIAQLDSDPHFRRLYPEKAEAPSARRTPGVLHLYEVAKAHAPGLVFDLETNDGNRWTPVYRPPSPLPMEARSPYVSFGNRQLAWEERCRRIRPTKAVLTARAGATRVGIGGGPEVRVLWNDTALELPPDRVGTGRWLARIARLPRPLRATDRLELQVCSHPKVSYYGIGLSLWRDDEWTGTAVVDGGNVSGGNVSGGNVSGGSVSGEKGATEPPG